MVNLRRKGKKEAKKAQEGAPVQDQTEGTITTEGAAKEEKSKAPNANHAKLLEMMKKLGMTTQNLNEENEAEKDHKFWKTQPVPQPKDEANSDGEIMTVPMDKLRTKSYPLPKDFEWVTVDITKEEELKEVYELLTYHYVEDDDAMFRFNYSANFLNWALKPPGWNGEWMVGVRVKTSRKLVAFISGIPMDLRVRKHQQRMVEINFLCIHKKLRSKRLAPVLIKEVTRRVNLTGIFQAVYTAGVVLPTPVATCRYFHRTLNYHKLLSTGFTRVPNGSTEEAQIRRFELPEATKTPGIRPMVAGDVPAVRALVNGYLAKYSDLSPVFGSDEEAAHWLLPVEDVLWTYVVEDPATGRVTGMFSYYSLPSSVIGNTEYDSLSAAYLNYYALEVAEGEDEAIGSVSEEEEDRTKHRERLTTLIGDALILAKKGNFDVFNCLHLLKNRSFINDLLFGPGDGFLNYYLFNWRTKEMKADRIGLVML